MGLLIVVAALWSSPPERRRAGSAFCGAGGCLPGFFTL